MATEVPSNQNPVDFYSSLFRSYRKRNMANIAREKRNWGFFSGVNFKQWSPEQLQVLIDEKRPPHQQETSIKMNLM